MRLFIHCSLVRCSKSFKLSFDSGTKLVTALKLEVTKATSNGYGLISKFIKALRVLFLILCVSKEDIAVCDRVDPHAFGQYTILGRPVSHRGS